MAGLFHILVGVAGITAVVGPSAFRMVGYRARSG